MGISKQRRKRINTALARRYWLLAKKNGFDPIIIDSNLIGSRKGRFIALFLCPKFQLPAPSVMQPGLDIINDKMAENKEFVEFGVWNFSRALRDIRAVDNSVDNVDKMEFGVSEFNEEDLQI